VLCCGVDVELGLSFSGKKLMPRVFESRVLRGEFGRKGVGVWGETGENCSLRSFIIYGSHNILLQYC